jgi:predicted DNA-binding antitoxin AbrB/MazE fold protein
LRIREHRTERVRNVIGHNPLHDGCMSRSFEAMYEDGVFKPLESLELPDRQRVTITITSLPDSGTDIAGYFEPDEWERSKTDDISLDEVRQALSSIKGSLADAVVDAREERI